MPSSFATEKAMPPLAVPSSLAIMMSVDVDRIREFLGLDQAVLAGGRVDDQKHFLRRVFDMPLHDLADLGQLRHQVGLVVQPAGRVDDQTSILRVCAACMASKTTAPGSEPCSWAMTGTSDRSPQTLSWSIAAARNVSPAASMTDAAEALVIGGQLGDRGRLADAVDADDHDHEGHAALQNLDLAVAGRHLQQRDHVVPQDVLGERRSVMRSSSTACLQVFDKLLTDIPAEIGLDQEHLQLFVKIFVERAAIEEPGDFTEHAAPGLFQTLLKFDIRFSLAAEEPVENHRARSPGRHKGRT